MKLKIGSSTLSLYAHIYLKLDHTIKVYMKTLFYNTLFVFSLAVLLSCAPLKTMKGSQTFITVKMEESNPSPCIYLNINGVRGKFVIDTGSQTTLITQTFFDQNLRGVSVLTPGVYNVNRKSTPFKLAHVALSVDGFSLGETQALIFNSVALDNQGIDGLLGFDVIKHYDFTIKQKSHEFLLGNLFDPNKLKALDFFDFVNTPLTKINVAGKTILIAIDTGSSRTSLREKDYEIIKDMNPSAEEEYYGNWDAILSTPGTSNSRQAFITENLFFSGEWVNNVKVHKGENSLLGMDVLGRYNIYHKAGKSYFYLEENTNH